MQDKVKNKYTTIQNDTQTIELLNRKITLTFSCVFTPPVAVRICVYSSMKEVRTSTNMSYGAAQHETAKNYQNFPKPSRTRKFITPNMSQVVVPALEINLYQQNLRNSYRKFQ